MEQKPVEVKYLKAGHAIGYKTSCVVKRTGNAGASGSLNKWAYLEDALNRKIDTTP